uniref:Uncharacterized protein n=1 Tax=Kalanchoe fedtschenkoi TaxID=63787 RepID=A0A7N0TTT5_KALFE
MLLVRTYPPEANAPLVSASALPQLPSWNSISDTLRSALSRASQASSISSSGVELRDSSVIFSIQLIREQFICAFSTASDFELISSFIAASLISSSDLQPSNSSSVSFSSLKLHSASFALYPSSTFFRLNFTLASVDDEDKRTFSFLILFLIN